MYWLLALMLAAPSEFELARPDGAAAIVVPADESMAVRAAVADLASDIGKISGKAPPVVSSWDDSHAARVVVLTAAAAASKERLRQLSPQTLDQLDGKWEAYRVRLLPPAKKGGQPTLLVAGSDELGTVFGIYAFAERYLGVDPLYFWADRPPQPQQRLAWTRVELTGDEPTFRYRGWFINDEDLLSEWYLDGGRREIDYPYYAHVTSPQAAARIYEAMLRLGYNLVIPASFVDIRNPAEARLVEAASQRGLWVSMHHVEPMGTSGFTFQKYWREKGQDVPFSFFRHPEKFEEVWRQYAQRWSKLPKVVWQLGLRGIADRPVWVSDPSAPKTDAERGKLISDAMARQWAIVRQVDPRPSPPATTTLWMEGASLHQQGLLKFPAGVGVIFSDNSPGWELQADFYQIEREPQRPYGVYYHHALWGSGPHLVQAVSPQRTHGIFKQVVERGSTYYAMLNVSNVREFVLGIDASSRMLRDFEHFDPDRFMTEWCRARFGPAAAAAERCYGRFFESFVADSASGRRRLLDGEAVRLGNRTVKLLIERLQARAKPLLKEPQKFAALLEEVSAQRSALQGAADDMATVLDLAPEQGRRFFETNFVAQHSIMLGLLEWNERTLQAGLALARGDEAAGGKHLEAAGTALGRVRQGQALAIRGGWKDWYRGDRKMNLAEAERLTGEAIKMNHENTKGRKRT